MKQELKHTAQGLAALGRYGDSMLMHVSPQEVAGLQALGRAHGARLTTNPHTGLPEAFSFGNFFKSLLPTAVGAITAPFLGPYGAVLAGAATGAATNRDNPLMGAVTGGLGAYGGASLGDAAVKSAASTGSKQVIQQAANTAASTLPAPAAGGPSMNTIAEAFGQAAPSVSPTGIPLANAGQEAVENAATIAKIGYQPPTGLAGLSQGVQGLGTEAGRGAFVNALGGPGQAAFKVGAPLAMATLSGMEPTALPQEEDKYDPYAKLNLDYSSGLRLLAEGGDITEMPDPGSNPLQNAQDAFSYGIGGLSYESGGLIANLLQQIGVDPNTDKSNSDAKFAGGGGVFADNKNLNLGGSGVNLGGGAGAYTPQQFEQMYNAYNQNRNLMSSFMVNPNKRPEVSPEQAQFNKMMQQSGPRVGGDPFGNLLYGRNLSDEQKAFNQQLQDYNKARMDYYKEQSPLKGFGGIYAGGAGTGGIGVSKPLNIWQGNTTMPSGVGSGPFAQSGKPLFAKGGFLDGPGDGMSDSIPATIGDKQPARLADGEFVVPADVVSHLGNGSTKAGAQRLYSMMDRVRKARTGTKKQGKQIKPEKYMPA
jgi:hypothetical protein